MGLVSMFDGCCGTLDIEFAQQVGIDFARTLPHALTSQQENNEVYVDINSTKVFLWPNSQKELKLRQYRQIERNLLIEKIFCGVLILPTLILASIERHETNILLPFLTAFVGAYLVTYEQKATLLNEFAEQAAAQFIATRPLQI